LLELDVVPKTKVDRKKFQIQLIFKANMPITQGYLELVDILEKHQYIWTFYPQ